MTSPSGTLDGLPKQFVSAMRTLFDIMDDKCSGQVNFTDIENRWQDDGSKGLPRGVLESLRKVTPPNGLLTFERFCAGLKICLLRNQVEQRTPRPPSAPLLDLDTKPNPTWSNNNNTAAVRPNVIAQRTLSMPQLLVERRTKENENPEEPPPLPTMKPPIYGPPKPPRSATLASNNIDRAEIRTALQNWQMGIIMNEDKKTVQPTQYAGLLRTGRSLGDGKAQNETTTPQIQTQTTGVYQKKANVRRREPRRHTLQNGIDYNMLKRIKQIEQEKDVLAQGLNAIEKARDWYLKQINAVQEKMKYLGRMGHVEPWSEAQQERLELQRARVFEVNRHLAALTDSWERGGLPLHMNLAVHHYPPHQPHQDLSTRLKQQNHLLTEEVSKKSERISILEREKASLIRELVLQRAPNRNNQEEAVF